MKSFIFIIYLFVICTCSFCQELHLSEVRIKDGPSVIYINGDNSDYVGLSLFVKFSADIPGLAHLAEHMAFASNSKMKSGDLDFIFENMGATCDAYTNYDYSVYKTVVNKIYLPQVLETLSYALFSPCPTQKELDIEKSIIKDEFAGREILGFDNIRYRLQKVLYRESYCGFPIEGNDISSITLEELKRFYAENYMPAKMTLVIYGNADKKEITQCIEKFYVKHNLKAYEMPQKITLHSENVRIKGARSYFGIIFNLAPTYMLKDAITCDVLSQMADMISASLIAKKYKYKSVYVHNSGKYASPFVLIYQGDDTDYIRQSILSAVEQLKKGSFSEYDLFDAKSVCLSDFLAKNTKADTCSYNTGFNYVMYDWKTVYSYDKYINGVTKEDIINCANKYFKDYASVICEKK